jgi:hypothetical protein
MKHGAAVAPAPQPVPGIVRGPFLTRSDKGFLADYPTLDAAKSAANRISKNYPGEYLLWECKPVGRCMRWTVTARFEYGQIIR